MPLVDELTEETFDVFSEFYCLSIPLTIISVLWTDFRVGSEVAENCSRLDYYSANSGHFLNYRYRLPLLAE